MARIRLTLLQSQPLVEGGLEFLRLPLAQMAPAAPDTQGAPGGRPAPDERPYPTRQACRKPVARERLPRAGQLSERFKLAAECLPPVAERRQFRGERTLGQQRTAFNAGQPTPALGQDGQSVGIFRRSEATDRILEVFSPSLVALDGGPVGVGTVSPLE